jgi:SAM-dependent methyltransferase
MPYPSPVVQERSAREKLEYDVGTVHAQSEQLHRRFAHVFTCPNTMRGERFFERVIAASVGNARVLDYGCYDGWMFPALAAHRPSEVVGIDISEKGISAAIAKHGDAAQYLVMDAHKLEFPDGHFDFIVGRAILHHLNFEVAIQEIHRVLKPGGRCLFYEPILGNPAAALFRLLTPSARTVDERPLSRDQLEWADGVFRRTEYQFVNLISTPVAMLTSVLGDHPNNFLLRVADRIDGVVERSGLRFWMRQVVVCWHKEG